MRETLIKRPSEDKLYDFDFTNLLRSGETITGTPTVTATPSGLTISGIAVASPKVQARIIGGADGITYKIEVTADTDQSNKHIDQGDLKVEA